MRSLGHWPPRSLATPTLRSRLRPQQGEHLATLGCDVLVLGTSLGGLISAAYLARLGLRVVVIEEEAQAKRPALLREPLLISGLAPGGPLRRVLRELALPLREQAQMEPNGVAAQVVLGGGRVDILPGREEGAREL